jgi:hypothetical protein
MKTLLIWSAILYGIPALISLAILFFQEDRGTIKQYLRYCGWCFVPAVNLVIIYFWILQLRGCFKEWTESEDREVLAILFTLKVFAIFTAAFLFLALIFYIGTYDFTK